MTTMKHMALTAAVLAAAVYSPAAEERVPRETAKAVVNGKNVSVEYGRPALGGRKMADLLSQLPADRIWRAGMDQATTLTTESDILIGGKRVPAGKYTVYVHAPAQGDYSLVLNSNQGIALKEIYAAAPPAVANELWPRLDGYDKVKATEVLRVPLRKGTAGQLTDRFLIGMAPAREGATALTMTWGDQTWTADVKAAPPAR
jgi:hypothetical protein